MRALTTSARMSLEVDELAASGQLDAAEPLAVAAAEALGQLRGEDHPDYANALATIARIAEHELAASACNLAVLYASSGRVEQARELVADAVTIVRSLTESHPVRVGVENCARSLACAIPSEPQRC